MNPSNKELIEVLENLISLEPLSSADRTAVLEVIEGKDSLELEAELLRESAQEEQRAASPARRSEGEMHARIASMGIPEKIKTALFGNATCRALLIRDPLRMVQQFVLKNPGLQISEVEEFARNPHLSEHVLRSIAGNQNWVKSYAVKRNLVTNPKLPLAISLKLFAYLNASDVRKIARSKNLPQPLVVQARKRVEQESSAQK